jgi:uncharacterized membrane protein (DUF2068 family)
MLSRKSSRRAVRLVAVFEAAKGLLVLLAGFGLLALLHRDVGAVANRLVAHLHLNPSRKYPQIFIDLASRATDERLWMFAGFAAVYATFRLVEAYGLWRERAWAEWVALVGGMIYLPIEIYGLAEKFTWLRVGTFLANVLIVALMAQVLWRSVQARRAGADA